MRVIKFRGKCVNYHNWLYGFYYRDYYSDQDIIIAEPFSHKSVVESDTVGQFTGICDIDGKEIYEGDILESAERPDSYSFGFWEVEDKNSDYGFTGHCGKMKISGKPFRRVVKWHEERAAFCLFLPLTDMIAGTKPLKMFIKDDKMRVIGNIYDNPELLKEDDKNEGD